MPTRTLRTELWLPTPIEQVFAFFSDAANLSTITPPWLDFRIITPQPIDMHKGALIDYRIRLHALPIRWRTIIEVWEPPHRFVDMQLRGPYSLWHHEHTFTPLDGGTLCRDLVHYRHLGGPIVHRLFVRPQLDRIFAFRQRTLRNIFLDLPNPDPEPHSSPAGPAHQQAPLLADTR